MLSGMQFEKNRTYACGSFVTYETVGLLWHYNAVFSEKSQLTEQATTVKIA